MLPDEFRVVRTKSLGEDRFCAEDEKPDKSRFRLLFRRQIQNGRLPVRYFIPLQEAFFVRLRTLDMRSEFRSVTRKLK